MKLGYVITYVPDVAAALDFYERAFGLTRRFLHPSLTYGELETGATALAFAAESMIEANGLELTRHDPAKLASATEIGLVTDDVDGAYERALAAGASAAKAPTSKPWGQRVAYVRDPFGALIELCSPMG